MGHSLTPGMLAVTLADVCAPIIFVEIDTAGGNVYLWSGYGNLVWNGQTWLGSANFGNISPVAEVAKVLASGVSFTLSGVNQALIAAALTDMRRYLPAKVWIGALDSSFAVIADPYLTFNGRVDSVNLAASGDTASIQVSAESRLITMRNARWRRYTDLDQRIERPNDGGFTMVDTIQDASINWHG